MKKLLPILMLLLGRMVSAAVALDSTASVFNESGTYTLTGIAVGNNAHRLLVVAMAQREPNINNVTGCVFNTTETMTKLVSIDGQTTSDLNLSVWYLKAPSVTTASTVCTVNNGGRNVMGSLSLHGVDQTNTFRDTDSAGNASATGTGDLTLTTVSGDYCIAALLAGNNGANVTNLVPGGTQSERWDVSFTPSVPNVRGGASTFVATGISTALSYTWTNTESWAFAVTAVQPAATGGPLFKRYYDLLRN